jgi:hypothetical protein
MPLSTFASSFNLRRYSKAYQYARVAATQAAASAVYGAAAAEEEDSALLKLLGAEKKHCAPLLEMLVLLEGVQLRAGVELTEDR